MARSDDPVSGGRLEQVLRAGDFAVTAETSPPDSADPADVIARAGCLKGLADGVNVLDGASARAHLSSLAAAAILARAGIEPVVQFTMRDRNRLALEADLLGAAALGAHGVLCLTGDSVEAGDQPDASPVFDIKSAEFMTIIRDMRDEGVFPGGRAIKAPPRLMIGAADAPFEPPPDFVPNGLLAKIAAGADFVQTQFCFDMAMLRRYMDRLRAHEIPDQVWLIIGIGPLRSAKSARWMNDNLFGVSIPEPVITRLESAKDPRAEGIRICIELIEELRTIDGVAGAHLMAPHGEAAIAEVIADSGVRKDRTSAPGDGEIVIADRGA